MKRSIKLYTSIVALVVLFMQCDESFLDRKPVDQKGSVDFWSNENEAQSALTVAYQRLSGGYWSHTEVNFVIDNFRSDLTKSGSDVLANYPDQNAFSIHNVQDNNGRMGDFWAKQYQGINAANQIIGNVTEMDDNLFEGEAKNEILGQAYFLRAYYHFKLKINWEEIIVVDGLATSSDDLYRPLAEDAAAWKAIEDDFTMAASLLPKEWDDGNKGRATKGAALGFKGKAQVYQQNWDAAVQSFEDVMGLNVYGLESDFASMFDATNELSQESMFEAAFTYTELSGDPVTYAGIANIAATELGGWEAMLPTDKLLAEMKKEGETSNASTYDARLYATLFFDDPNVDIYGNTYEDIFGAGSTKIGWKKYLRRNTAPWEYAGGYRTTDSDVNQVLLRYADVLLLYAEAKNELGNTADAIAIINDIRNMHGDMPATTATSQSEVRAAIMHERLMEFPLEGQRFFDLRRWGDNVLEDAMKNSGKPGANNFNLSDDKYLPIPVDERNNNPLIN